MTNHQAFFCAIPFQLQPKGSFYYFSHKPTDVFTGEIIDVISGKPIGNAVYYSDQSFMTVPLNDFQDQLNEKIISLTDLIFQNHE